MMLVTKEQISVIMENPKPEKKEKLISLSYKDVYSSQFLFILSSLPGIVIHSRNNDNR